MGPREMHGGLVMPHSAVESVVESVQCTLHGVEYLLSVSTSKDEVLTVEVEQCSDASRWRGEFTQRYVEDITSKTGNFKKYHVFAKMLLSALKGASESVFIDLLTYEDLEALKARRGSSQPGAVAAAPLQSKIPKNNKRYLILTYSSEFDRVHYPLPLVYEEHPDPTRLKEIIRELRMQVSDLIRSRGEKSHDTHMDVDLGSLKEENMSLKRQIEALYAGGVTADRKEAREAMREMRLALKERDLLLRRAESAEAELERDRGLHRREIRKHTKEVQELGDELNRCRQELRDQRIKCRELTRQLDSTKPRNSRVTPSTSNVRGRPVPDRKVSPARSKGARSTRSIRSTSSRGLSPSASAMSQSSCDEGSNRSRPRSAPTRARFDPTQYVQKKREKEKITAQRKRFSSPGFGSGRSSSVESRSQSQGRFQRNQREASNGRQRRPLLPNSSTNRIRDQSPNQYPKKPYPARSQRASSPGQALQDVKQRLNEFKPKQHARISSPRAPSIDSSSHDFSGDGTQEEDVPNDRYENEPGRFADGSVELADVDSRLQALQNFLRMAKASATSTDT